MTVCEIFFKLKFSKSIQNISTLESFGKFLLIVPYVKKLCNPRWFRLQTVSREKLVFVEGKGNPSTKLEGFIFDNILLCSTNTVAQSICTQYSCFENQGRFVTLKKIGHPAFFAKNQGHCYSKREEAAWSLLFWITMTLFFCTLLFATHILDFFLKFQILRKY